MLAMWQSNGAAITDIIAFSGKKKIYSLPAPLCSSQWSISTDSIQAASNGSCRKQTDSCI